MIYICFNNVGHPVIKTFTTLHYISPNYISLQLTTLVDTSLSLIRLHPTTLHYPLIWLNPFYISYRSISPHITTLHLTSLHCTFRWFSLHF